MKKEIIRNFYKRVIIWFFGVMLITTSATLAKSHPIWQQPRARAFERAKSLDNGVSISWLEQTWAKNILTDNAPTKTDLELLKKLGFKSIRLPVAFEFMQAKGIPLDSVFERIDGMLKLCHTYGFKLVLDYHYGEINDQNYVSATAKAVDIWVILAKRYLKESPDDLFFELYNEPPHMNPDTWKDAAYNIATAVRKVDKERTLIVGASNFNSIYELSRFVRLADDNIIYTVHFYEPFLFTHQGASWVGDQVATVGVGFPYNAEKFPPLNLKAKGTWGETNYYQYRTDGNEQSLTDKLMIVKKWSAKYGVPVICSEYGVYNRYADLDSRCRYIKAMRATLKKLGIPGIMWEYNSNFSIFEGAPSVKNLPDCMKDAIGYTNKK